MMNIKEKSKDSVLPSIEGRGAMSLGCDDGGFISPKENCKAVYGGGSPFNWSLLLKTLVAVLTALAGALGLSACGRW